MSIKNPNSIFNHYLENDLGFFDGKIETRKERLDRIARPEWLQKAIDCNSEWTKENAQSDSD